MLRIGGKDEEKQYSYKLNEGRREFKEVKETADRRPYNMNTYAANIAASNGQQGNRKTEPRKKNKKKHKNGE